VSWLHDPMDVRCECGHSRRRHAHDLPWARSGGSHCLLELCPCEEFLPPVRTAKGTIIRRWRGTGVGKRVGSHLYLHGGHALEAIAKIKARDPDVGLRMELALAHRIKEFPAFRFRCVRLDLEWGYVRFDQAPDFDTAREPRVGWWLEVRHDGYVRKGESDAIWHHKWLWVKDGYPGFDVAASRAWSARYAPLIAGAPLGTRKGFEAQLEAAGLA